MKIALFGKMCDEASIPYIQNLFKLLYSRGIEISIYKRYLEIIKDQIQIDGPVTTFSSHKDLGDDVDYLFSIGGDGTLLDTITLVRDSGIPIMGINTGRLGFLSSVGKTEIENAIDSLVHKNYTLSKRSLLRLDSSDQHFGNFNFALNELTIHQKDTPSLIAIHVHVNDKFLNSYWADGLIVSTPTGSTGYSLSCGGPILSPHNENFIITPIATHNLTVRPIVIPDSGYIKITVNGRIDNFLVGLDARFETFSSTTELNIRKENFTVNLVNLPYQDFFATIREKLTWGLDSRNYSNVESKS